MQFLMALGVLKLVVEHAIYVTIPDLTPNL